MIDQHLHNIWSNLYEASKDGASPHECAFTVLQIQGQGNLMKDSGAANGIEMANTSDGIIWADLPFFALDMRGFWIKDCASMSATERLGFSAFLAKVASAGRVDERLFKVPLIIFGHALETTRSLGDIGGTNGQDATRSLDDLTIADLLPIVRIWVFEAGKNIIQLCDKSWQSPDSHESVGSLYRDDAMTKPQSVGFSPGRWIFWMRRVEEIAAEAKTVGKKELADFATEVLDLMLMVLRQSHSRVKMQFEKNPDVIKHRSQFWETLTTALSADQDS